MPMTLRACQYELANILEATVPLSRLVAPLPSHTLDTPDIPDTLTSILNCLGSLKVTIPQMDVAHCPFRLQLQIAS